MAISKTVRDAWQANDRVNAVLLDHLTPEMLEAQTPGGGWTVAHHLAHMTGVVKYWGMDFAPKLEALPDLHDENGVMETDLSRIREVMEQTREAALEAATSQPEGDKGKLPHPSVEAYLIHMLVHEAHHRGQILLALKTNGYPLPDEDSMWGPWRGE